MRNFTPPRPQPEIHRVTSLQILGVTVTESLSASDHVRDVITRCAQTLLYAFRVLRCPRHGRNPALHTVYQSMGVVKVMYTSSSWCGFTNAADRQRVDTLLSSQHTKWLLLIGLAFLWRNVRGKQTSNSAKKYLTNPNHMLHNLYYRHPQSHLKTIIVSASVSRQAIATTHRSIN